MRYRICNQEEADTRMISHAAYAKCEGSECLVINTPDTDVLVLLLHHYKALGVGEIYMSTGSAGIHTDSKRYIPVHSLHHALSENQITGGNIMLSLNCLSGCDNTSSFYGKGIKKVYKLMVQNSAKSTSP